MLRQQTPAVAGQASSSVVLRPPVETYKRHGVSSGNADAAVDESAVMSRTDSSLVARRVFCRAEQTMDLSRVLEFAKI